jgi:hypothetical protein
VRHFPFERIRRQILADGLRHGVETTHGRREEKKNDLFHAAGNLFRKAGARQSMSRSGETEFKKKTGFTGSPSLKTQPRLFGDDAEEFLRRIR